MGASAAVEILHRKRLAAVPTGHTAPALTTELAAEHARLAGGLDRAAHVGVLNALMEPADTRSVLAAAIAAAPAERGEHGDLPL